MMPERISMATPGNTPRSPSDADNHSLDFQTPRVLFNTPNTQRGPLTPPPFVPAPTLPALPQPPPAPTYPPAPFHKPALPLPDAGGVAELAPPPLPPREISQGEREAATVAGTLTAAAALGMPALGLVGLGVGMGAGIIGNRYAHVLRRRLGRESQEPEPENRAGLLFINDKEYGRYNEFRRGIPYSPVGGRESLLPSTEEERRIELAQLKEWAEMSHLKALENERRERARKETILMLRDLSPRGRQILDRTKLYQMARDEGKDYKQLTREYLKSSKTAEQLLEEEMSKNEARKFLRMSDGQRLRRGREATEAFNAGSSGASSSGLQRDVGPIATVAKTKPQLQ